MAKMEQLEMDAHRGQLVADVQNLVERYRSIFGWDIPGIDQQAADRLILQAMRDALDGLETVLGAKAGS
jgi:hypothetical protein